MFQYDPGPAVYNNPRTVQESSISVSWGACNRHKQHIRKRTMITASCYDLVYYIDGRVCRHGPTKCNGQHQHRYSSEAQQSQMASAYGQTTCLGCATTLDRCKQLQRHIAAGISIAKDASVTDQRITPTMV